MDIKNLKRNIAAIEGGMWVDNIPMFGDGRLRVRGIGYKVYQARLQRLTRSCAAEDRNIDGSLKPEAAIRIMGEAMAEELLLEWDGLSDGNNPDGSPKPVPFDKGLAKEWMTSSETRPFLDAVVYAANVVELGREGAEKLLGGN